jgi:hypothetical protein
MKTITTTRLILEPEERAITKRWGSDWARMKKDEKKHGAFFVLMGEWSGYNGCSRLVHTEYVPYLHGEGIVLRTIRYTDGTTLNISVRRFTVQTLLSQKVERKAAYDELVYKARASSQVEYAV